MFDIICHLGNANQNNTTLKLVEWLKSKTLTTLNVGKHVMQQKLSFFAGRNAKYLTVRQFLTKCIIFLIYNSAIALLGIYVDEFKTPVHIKACTLRFIASLVITVKTWRQPKCPSVGKWINCFIQTME